MKMQPGLLLSLALAASVSAEVVFEDLDGYAAGPVTNNPGWIISTSLTAIPGVVTNVNAYSSPNCLELPYAGAISNTAATYKNFLVTNSIANPIMRLGARLLRDPTNGWENVAVSLGRGVSARIVIANDVGNGHIRIAHQGAPALITGVEFRTNRYANLAFYYNMTNNTMALDYDGTNIVAWTNAGGSAETWFDFVQLSRLAVAGAVERKVRFDDISLATFPASTWAWWRFEEGNGQQIAEALGHFPVTNSPGLIAPGNWAPSPVDLYYDGAGDAHNRYGLRAPALVRVRPQMPTPVFSNWTVEAVFRSSAVDNFQFVDWGTGSGFDATNSYIFFAWVSANSNLTIHVRDAEQTSTADSYYNDMGTIPPDNRWHHVAAVKKGANLSTYVDYVFKVSTALDPNADGSYSFGTNAWMSIGQSLSFGNTTTTNVQFDEVRISTSALNPTEFLQPARPIFVDMTLYPLFSIWSLTAQTISGKTYRAFFSTNVGDWAGASEVQNFTATAIFSTFEITMPTQKTSFIRLRRE